MNCISDPAYKLGCDKFSMSVLSQDMGMTSTATYLTSFPLIFVVILTGSVLVTFCEAESCGSVQDLPKTCDR